MINRTGEHPHYLVPLLHESKAKTSPNIAEIRQKIISIPLPFSASMTDVTLGRIELIQAIIRSCSRIHETKECHHCAFLRKNAKFLQRQMLRFQCFDSQERNTSFAHGIKMYICDNNSLLSSSKTQEHSSRPLIRINDESVCDILHRVHQDKVSSSISIPQDIFIPLKNGDIITIFIPILNDDSNLIQQNALSDYPQIQFCVCIDVCSSSYFQKSTLSQDKEESPMLSIHRFSQTQDFPSTEVNRICSGEKTDVELLVSPSQNLYSSNNDDDVSMMANTYLRDSAQSCAGRFVSNSSSALLSKTSIEKKFGKGCVSLIMDCGISQLIDLRDVSNIREGKSVECQRRIKLRQALLNLSIMRHQSETDDFNEKTCSSSHILSMTQIKIKTSR